MYCVYVTIADNEIDEGETHHTPLTLTFCPPGDSSLHSLQRGIRSFIHPFISLHLTGSFESASVQMHSGRRPSAHQRAGTLIGEMSRPVGDMSFCLMISELSGARESWLAWQKDGCLCRQK